MHLIVDIIRNSILITGLVVVMMMMIESLNIESRGMIFNGLKRTRFGQVAVAALLGSIPGCMGGFAAVSLYTHRMLSFGALVAMMIASSGDEAFLMLAMIPGKAIVIFAVLFILAIVAGYITDIVNDMLHKKRCPKDDHSGCEADTDCPDGYVIHEETTHGHGKRHFGWKRMVMLIGLALFIAALASGSLAHEHGPQESHVHHEETHHTEACTHCHESQDTFSINLLDEQWMNIIFAGLSLIVLFVLVFASDHFVEEHLWNHIVKKHLPTIFAWTAGVLLILGIVLQHVDISRWIGDNTALMILLATLIGIIPESGPHMIFVTLYATGIVPFPVLLASCISQDGHSSLPLLAESRKSFIQAKAVNCFVALAGGFAAMLIQI